MKVLQQAPQIRDAIEQLLQEHRELTDWELQFLMVFTPAIVGFVDWVLEEAQKAGKACLYFLARDGYLLYQVARELASQKGVGLELKYLKVSRQSLRSAQYHLQRAECLDYLCTGGIDITFEKIMKRAGVSEEVAVQTAYRVGYADRYREVLNYGMILELKSVLKNDNTFLSEVYRIAKEKYPNTMGYLRQEGLLEGDNYGLVDTGWIGTLQKTLEQLVASERTGQKLPRMDGYYFGLYEIPRDMDVTKYHAYYFEPWNYIRRKVYFANSLMEAVISAPHGMTMEYCCCKKEKNRYEAQETEDCNPNADRILREAELLKLFLVRYRNSNRNRRLEISVLEKLFCLFMAKPQIEEVEFWGGFQFCDDVLEGQMQCVAVRLSEQEIKKQWFVNKLRVIMGKKKEEIHESAWLEGSIVRMGTHVGRNLRHVRFYKYILYMRKAWKQRENQRRKTRKATGEERG